MNLSDISIKDIVCSSMFNTLENIVFSDDDNRVMESDIGLVFGGVAMLNRANNAVYLYKKGLIKRILLSGGIGYLNTNRSQTEASILNDYLIKKGIPECDILLESKSKDTIENVEYCTDLLNNYYDLSKIRLVIITSDFHTKRCFYLMNNYIKNLYVFPSTDGVTNKDVWRDSYSGISNTIKEAIILKNYVDRKLIDDFEVDVVKRTR